MDLIPIDVTAHSPAQGKGEEKAPNSYYQPLFDLLNQEHGLLPLETEMRDIVEVVNKMQAAHAPAEGGGMPTEDDLVTEVIARFSGNSRGNPIAKKAFIDCYIWIEKRMIEGLREAPVSDAVEFAEWIIKNNYYHVSDKYESYWCAFGGECIVKDTTELYTLFLKH